MESCSEVMAACKDIRKRWIACIVRAEVKSKMVELGNSPTKTRLLNDERRGVIEAFKAGTAVNKAFQKQIPELNNSKCICCSFSYSHLQAKSTMLSRKTQLAHTFEI